ncbi:hypothetical protein NESM_000227400 [Novymonas esmeraldas]|uniref:Uncharacterized protein n=1 Tax=Novymonas esmeraldas TaxID=1808958 RepID=A0AAW0FB94_9TRYP
MYNPALPNHYRDVAFAAYVRRRDEEEEAAVQRQRQPNALASALSAASLASSSSSSSPLPSSGSSPTSAMAGAPPSLGLSAEELHQHRVKESAALGVQRAVLMEKEALEVEHKKRKLEGSDARSRISSRLDKLKALAGKSRSVAGDAGAEPAQTQPSPTSSPAEVTPSAPLVFQRSSLAAGGFVMTAADPALPGVGQRTAVRPAVQGRPSSTLLLRFLAESPLQTWTAADIAQAAAATPAEESPLCAPALAQVQQLCRRFGFVRSMAARVYEESVVKAALARAVERSSSGRSVSAREEGEEEVRREQLRVWVRLDSVTEAFKAAESLAKESVADPSGAAGHAARPRFAVYFYPTSLYDANTLELRDDDLLLLPPPPPPPAV